MFAFKLTDHSLNCKPKNPINNCPALRRAITKQVTDMQASIETISTLERKMTIAVPAERVETQVEQRLNEAARTVQLKGFRKGKVPVKVVKERYGGSVRQEVLGEVITERGGGGGWHRGRRNGLLLLLRGCLRMKAWGQK